ncbi:MAG: glycosyltransferase family 9 protein [Bacteroidaceae bacterium]|nr:glycosyltransferase family 9 protein [Bacteroidaceae bacterium]
MIRKLLVIRFSALGDVAMTVPVVRALAEANPDTHITILTRQRMQPLFEWMPANVAVEGIDLGNYSGVAGLERLYRRLHHKHYDAVADLHDVLRSKYLRTRFRMSGAKIAVIDKGRKDKKALIGHGLTHSPLTHTITRYQHVFTSLGMSCPMPTSATDASPASLSASSHVGVAPSPASLSASSPVGIAPSPVGVSAARFGLAVPPASPAPSTSAPLIGVAPFAAHKGKIYPLPLMHQVVDQLADAGNHVLLFGAKGKETETLKTWERRGVELVADKCHSLKEELELMSQLTLMISMDSSNMHMAAMMGTQTISIWGATHPSAGFTAWQQTHDSIIDLPMDCRPCSIYGNRPCTKGNYPCLAGIKPQTIIDKARQYGAL